MPNEGCENKREQRGNDQRLENFTAEIENGDDCRRDDDAAGEDRQCSCRELCGGQDHACHADLLALWLLVNADAQAQFPHGFVVACRTGCRAITCARCSQSPKHPRESAAPACPASLPGASEPRATCSRRSRTARPQLEKLRREHRVPILAALALLDPDQHLGVGIRVASPPRSALSSVVPKKAADPLAQAPTSSRLRHVGRTLFSRCAVTATHFLESPRAGVDRGQQGGLEHRPRRWACAPVPVICSCALALLPLASRSVLTATRHGGSAPAPEEGLRAAIARPWLRRKFEPLRAFRTRTHNTRAAVPGARGNVDKPTGSPSSSGSGPVTRLTHGSPKRGNPADAEALPTINPQA